jgi:TRAP transporter TAXI family solute receptor
MTGLLRAAFLCLLAALAACARGPAEDVLRQELQARLDTGFQEGLFSVGQFKRSGSAPFHDLESGQSGVYVYYTARLELLQDYGLTEWQGLNLGTLAFAIGATESGIEGFRGAGNERGESLSVHGRFAYQADDEGGWVSLDRSHERERRPGADRVADTEGRGARVVVRDVRALLSRQEGLTPDTPEAIIVEELNRAIELIDLRTARLEKAITLGSGRESGTYYAFGKALQHYAGEKGIAVFSAESQGSVQNASLLQAGRIDFGLVQSDVAQVLYEGWKLEGFFPALELRAVASLWPEAVHLVTLESTGIRTVDDLAQRRIAIGQRGSGSRMNALLVGLLVNIPGERRPTVRDIGLARAIEQLEAGELDAFFLTEAVPAPAIQALAARRPDLRFVPIPLSLLERIPDRQFAYYPVTVAARTYPGQREPFTTLGLTAMLLTNVHVADERVEQLLDLLATGGDELARDYYRAAFISRETMRLGLAVPLHPAAARYHERFRQDSALPRGSGQTD